MTQVLHPSLYQVNTRVWLTWTYHVFDLESDQ
ncbi:MAG: hypothetical protein H6Q86_5923 [candidate division NC10 bacterium]|nr:hypothetical protein [candidate division NC10 bacterium]